MNLFSKRCREFQRRARQGYKESQTTWTQHDEEVYNSRQAGLTPEESKKTPLQKIRQLTGFVLGGLLIGSFIYFVNPVDFRHLRTPSTMAVESSTLSVQERLAFELKNQHQLVHECLAEQQQQALQLKMKRAQIQTQLLKLSSTPQSISYRDLAQQDHRYQQQEKELAELCQTQEHRYQIIKQLITQ
jgi:hypothetical protein